MPYAHNMRYNSHIVGKEYKIIFGLLLHQCVMYAPPHTIIEFMSLQADFM